MTDGVTSPEAPTSADLSALLARELRARGADAAFGVPGGGQNLELLGAAAAEGVRFVLTQGETAAAIMAATYGELTGRPTACVVTRGPGLAAAVNGVAHALLDRQPLVLVSDTVREAERTRIAHQALDQRRLLSPVTRWGATLGPGDPLATVRRALDVATGSPPGPVHLDVDPTAPPAAPPDPPPRAVPAGDPERAAVLLAAASRPLVLAGAGAVAAADGLRDLVESAGVPVLTTYRAKGVVPERGPHAAGLLTGGTLEGDLIRDADLLLAVGLDTVELIPGPWPYRAPVVSVAEWPDPSTYLVPDVELVGPLPELLDELRPHLRSRWPQDAARRARLAALRAIEPVATGALGPHEVVRAARRIAPEGTVATVDAGAHMLVAMPLWEVDRPREALISCGASTMGFALPAAVAAALARPGARVVAFTGDGGLAMVAGELETLARLSLPVTVVVLNDAALSLIRIKQRPGADGGPAAVTHRPTDFAAVARGFGVPGWTVDDAGSLAGALGAALRRDGPALVDARIDPSGYPHVLEAIRGGSRP